MRQGEKQKTSVFSEYENNQNDSITSRQLQFWLKQTAPTNQPKIPNEWTLMSTNSIYQEDEHVLFRNPTFQTINKQNDSVSYNTIRQNQNTSAVLKSKSYLNAMADLQSKVKKLEQQNASLKNSLRFIKQDRNRSMSQSSVVSEQLKERLAILQPKAKKLDQFVRQNKKLRDWREENMKKTKIMQKMIKEYGQRFNQYQRQLAYFKDTSKNQSRVTEQGQIKYKELQKTIEKLKAQNNRLSQKNKVLQDMKQRATTSVLQKYSKSVNQIQLLTIQNDSLRRQLNHLKIQAQDKIRSKQQQSRRQKEQLINSNQRLKQENIQKKQMISTLKNQLNYFKENYQKSKEEFMRQIKNHSKEMQEARQKQMLLKMQIQIDKQKISEMQKQRLKQVEQLHKQMVFIQPKRQEIYLSKESIIQSQANNKNQIESQLQFEQPEQMQSIPFYETRSAIDKESDRNMHSRIQNNKQLDTLSQENYHENIHISQTKSKERKFTNAALKKLNANHKPQQIKQKTSQKIKERSQQKVRSKKKSKEKSRQKSRDIERNQGFSNQHSFILKSHEPLTHKEEPQYLYYTEQPANNSANNRKYIPYYWDSNEVADFAVSQRANNQNYNNNSANQNPFTSQFKLEQALLNQINREAVRLIEEQQRLVLSFSDQNLTPNERAEQNGRMKQLNEQIRINHQKRLQIKQRMNQN